MSNSTGVLSYTVFNAAGQMIKSEDFGEAKSIFNVECQDMLNGVYSIQMLTKNGLKSQQFIVNHN